MDDFFNFNFGFCSQTPSPQIARGLGDTWAALVPWAQELALWKTLGPTEESAWATTTVELDGASLEALAVPAQSAWLALSTWRKQSAGQELSARWQPSTEDFGGELLEKGQPDRLASDLHSLSVEGQLVSSSSALPPEPPFPSSSGSSPWLSASCSPQVEVHHLGEEDWKCRP